MEPIIKIRNLSKSYGSNRVLKDINLEINKGELIGYIGPNGAGKSTTVKIMLGLIEDYSGDIEIFGENIREKGVEYKRKIGYVPEAGHIYDNLTAREYIGFIGELYGMEYELAVSKGEKLMDQFGIRSVYDSRINSFSKGMKQKVMIISALLNNPDILFLDEPLAGIDANSVMVFKEVMSELVKRGKTIFYSSHIMEVVEKLSSRIILLKDGEIIADGTMENLKTKLPEDSLEEIFNKLTGFDQHEELAREIVEIMENGDKSEGL